MSLNCIFIKFTRVVNKLKVNWWCSPNFWHVIVKDWQTKKLPILCVCVLCLCPSCFALGKRMSQLIQPSKRCESSISPKIYASFSLGTNTKILNVEHSKHCMSKHRTFWTSHFGPKLNFEHDEHHKKLNSSRTSNCMFQD